MAEGPDRIVAVNVRHNLVLTNATDRPGGVLARQGDPGNVGRGPDRIAAVNVRHNLAKPRGILITRLQPRSPGGRSR